MWTKELRLKKATHQKRIMESGQWINPIYIDGVIEKIKRTKQANPIKFSEERLELSSKLAAERMISNKNSNVGCYKYGNMGYFFSKKNNKDLRFRSQFEKRAFEFLENDDSVIKYEHEPFHIKYIIDGKSRYYIPDILANYKLGKQKLIEVKPLAMTNTKEFLAKQEYAKDYCIAKNITYELWTEVLLFPNRKKY